MSYLIVDVCPEGETTEQRSARHRRQDEMWLRLNREARRRERIKKATRTLLKGIVILLSFVVQAVVIYIVSLLLSRYVH